MRRTILLGTMAIFMLAASSVSASDIPCEACDAKAMEAVALNAGVGNHRIYSMSTGTIAGFNVACPDGKFEDRSARTQGALPADADGQSIFPACRKSLVAQPLALNAASRLAIKAVHELTLAIEKTGGPVVDFSKQKTPGTFVGSVLDVMNDYPSRQSMFDWVAGKSALIERYNSAVDATALADLRILSAQLPMTLSFKDGSSVRAFYTASTRVLSLLEESSRASTGVAIVEANTSNFSGTYKIAGMDLPRYSAYLTSLGIAVTGTGEASMKCTWKASKLSCNRSDTSS